MIEDIAIVLGIVLTPALAAFAAGESNGADLGGIAGALALTLGKILLFVVLMLVVGGRFFPWLIVRVGLRPLRAVAQALEARGAAELAPLPASPYRELAPVVDAVNRLMRRLSERLAREHEFLADAAHELKTPLSVVQLNAHLLEASTEAAQKTEAGAGLREAVEVAVQMVGLGQGGDGGAVEGLEPRPGRGLLVALGARPPPPTEPPLEQRQRVLEALLQAEDVVVTQVGDGPPTDLRVERT